MDPMAFLAARRHSNENNFLYLGLAGFKVLSLTRQSTRPIEAWTGVSFIKQIDFPLMLDFFEQTLDRSGCGY